MKIITGKKIPPKRSGRNTKYPFERMKEGQSFAIETESKDGNRIRRSILTTAKNRGYKIQTAMEGTILNVWRL